MRIHSSIKQQGLQYKLGLSRVSTSKFCPLILIFYQHPALYAHEARNVRITERIGFRTVALQIRMTVLDY